MSSKYDVTYRKDRTNNCGILFMRGFQNFVCVWGGGGPGPTARKQSGQRFLVLSSFFYYRENDTFPRIQRRSIIFQGGGASNFFQEVGGSNANFYRNPHNL